MVNYIRRERFILGYIILYFHKIITIMTRGDENNMIIDWKKKKKSSSLIGVTVMV